MKSDYLSELNAHEIIRGIKKWVGTESPTTYVDGVNQMMDLAENAMHGLGLLIERIPGTDGFGDLVKARTPWGGDRPGILILGHMDTVHPVGTLQGSLPLRHKGDKIYGPGIYDMKGGLYISYYALRQIVRAGGKTPLPITFMFIPDEEMGSPTTRGYIEAEALKSKYVLVPEPAQDSGHLITGRWAFARFSLHTRGIPAHAGANLNQGHSSIKEMARQIIHIEGLSNPDRNITLSAGVIQGGTFVNVVPIDCRAEVLAVMSTQDTFDEIRAHMLSLKSFDSNVELRIEQGPIRPVFKANKNVISLYRKVAEWAKGIGLELDHGEVGGGSDGNFTGALGIPTLDGLGVCGDGFHTHNERLLVSSLVPRTQLWVQVLKELK